MNLLEADPKTLPKTDEFSIHVLASGSAGNCTIIREGDSAYVIDFGLSVDRLVAGIRQAGVRLHHPREHAAAQRPDYVPNPPEDAPTLRAALLTHVHRDHLTPSALSVLAHNHVALFLHDSHARALGPKKHFLSLREAGRVELYDGRPFLISPRTLVKPLALPHDSEHTFGFIFLHRTSAGREYKFTYLADLGHFPEHYLVHAADSDVLALEFNHDEELERTSGRAPHLIARVLGPHGHLSNEAAGRALEAILRASRKRRPHHIVLLHLSRDCNTPSLALRHARRALAGLGISAHLLVAAPDRSIGPINLLPREARR